MDSFAVCRDYLTGRSVPESLRITHFLFNDVGSHGRGFDPVSARLFAQRTPVITEVATTLGIPLIRVRSNTDSFYDTPFAQTHTLRNASVALMLQGRASRFLYASGYPYQNIGVRLTKDIACIDPILLPLLSTETLSCVSAGAGYSRVDKTRLICDWPLVRENLDVCVVDFPNCSKCYKCARTLLTLDVLGQLRAFSSSFDVAAYSKTQPGHIAHVFASRKNDPLAADIIKLMSTTGYFISKKQKFLNSVACTLYWLSRRIQVWRLWLLYRRVTGFLPKS